MLVFNQARANRMLYPIVLGLPFANRLTANLLVRSCEKRVHGANEVT